MAVRRLSVHQAFGILASRILTLISRILSSILKLYVYLHVGHFTLTLLSQRFTSGEIMHYFC